MTHWEIYLHCPTNRVPDIVVLTMTGMFFKASIPYTIAIVQVRRQTPRSMEWQLSITCPAAIVLCCLDKSGALQAKRLRN
jgi:heme/copper-type cytochrome/quinol oxidase subunit 3